MNENKIQNEEELWNVLDGTAPAAPKSESKPKSEPKPKSEGKFAKSGAPKGKVDSFFLTCMVGVAAVSVAATMLITSLVSPDAPKAPVEKNPVVGTNAPAVPGETEGEDVGATIGEDVGATVGEDVGATVGETTGASVDDPVSDELVALEKENAELREQVRLQKEQIKKLQAELLDLSGGEEMPTLSTEPDGDNEEVNAQLEAYEIFNKIKEAYTNFDREALEKLIPEMDKRLEYLSNDALNEYYTMLEYVEQPSNG